MINQISIAKGICIILMVMAHAGSPLCTIRFIYMFHMPFFFIISGYCFKERYLSQSKTFLYKKVKGLYWPYLKWSLVFLLLHNLFYKLHIYDSTYGYIDRVTFEQTPSYIYSFADIKSFMYSIIVSMTGHESLLGGFWFLKQLLWGSVIGFLVLKILRIKWLSAGGVCLAMLIMNYFDYSVPYIYVGWLSFFAAFYYVCGVCFSEIKIFNSLIDNTKYVTSVAALIIVIIAYVLPYFEMMEQNIKTIPLYILASLCGFFLVMSISRQVEKHDYIMKFLCFCGNNTLSILTWHFLSFKLVSLFLIWRYSQPIEKLAEFPQMREFSQQGWWMFYLIVGVSVPLLFTYMYQCLKFILNEHINNKPTSI